MIDGTADGVLRALDEGGFDLGLDARLRILTLLAELAARGGRLDDRATLAAYLTPLVAREPADALRVEAALSDAAPATTATTRAAATPAPRKRLDGRRLALILGGLAVLVILSLAAWRLGPRIMAALSAKPPPVAEAPQAATPTAAPATPTPRPTRSLDAAKASIAQTADAFAGAPTLRELWSNRVFDEPPEIIAQRVGVPADQPISLKDGETIAKLLHAIAPADDATTTRAANDVAATSLADAREARLANALTPSPGQTEVIAPVLAGMQQRTWTTAELAAWARTVDPASASLPPDRVARVVAARAAVARTPLQLSDAPWAQGGATPATLTLTGVLRRSAPLLAALAAGFAGLIAWFVAALRLRGVFERGRPLKPVRLIELILAREPQARRAALRGLAERLSRPRAQSSRIDMAASVAATARHGGLFTLVSRERMRTPQYLFLVDRRARADHLAEQLGAMMQRLAQEHVDLRWLFFERQPDRVRAQMGGASQDFARVASRDSNRQLVLVGDAAALAEPSGPGGGRWRKLIAQWGETLFLPTQTPASWGRAERTMARRLDARLDILADDLFEKLSAGGGEPAPPPPDADETGPTPIWLTTEEEIWTSERSPSPELLAELDRDLAREVGYHGLRWLRACAVYPQLHWRLTEALGQTLVDHAGAALATPERGLRLNRLPWLRLGEMPEWLRGRLLDRMEPQDAALVRARLAELLDQATLSETDIVEGLAVGLDGGEHPYADRTFARFVIRGRGDRRARGLEAGRRLRRLLDTSLDRRLMHPRALVWLAIGAAAALLAAYRVNALNGRPISAVMLILLASLAALGAASLIGLGLALALGGRRTATGAWARFAAWAVAAWTAARRPRPRQSIATSIRGGLRAAWASLWRPAAPPRRMTFLMAGFAIVMTMFAWRTADLALSKPSTDFSAPTAPIGARAALADRNGVLLAVDVPTWSVTVDMRRVTDPAALRAGLLSASKTITAAKIDAAVKRASVTVLERNADDGEAKRLRALGLAGLDLLPNRQRSYPQGATAAQLLGLTNSNGEGLSGAELGLDSLIRARAMDGAPIRLALDLTTQKALDAALLQGLTQSQAKRAAGVILDSKTGEVLALSSLPSFDPNARANLAPDALTNRAVSSLYEFGGDLWTVMSVAAVPGPTLDPAKPADLQAMFKAFGLLDKSPIELSEARAPLVLKTPWSFKDVAALSTGRGIALPLINMASAEAVLVNQGQYVAPTIQRVDGPRPQRPVLDPATVQTLLSAAATDVKANPIPGRDPQGGRAASSAKVVMGAYSKTHVVASYLGWFHPKAGTDEQVIAILFDEPQVGSATGVATHAADQVVAQLTRAP